MVWAIDMDDFRGICGPENALLKVLYKSMKNYKVPVPSITTTPRPEWARPKSTTYQTERPVQLDETTRKPTTTTGTKGTKPTKPPSSTKKPTKKRTTVTRRTTPKKPKTTMTPEIEETTTTKKRRVTKPTKTTTPEPEEIEQEENEIEEDSDDDYDCSDPDADFLPHKQCDKYVRCVHGNIYVMPCRPDTVFHTVENVCVWPHESDREECRPDDSPYDEEDEEK